MANSHSEGPGMDGLWSMFVMVGFINCPCCLTTTLHGCLTFQGAGTAKSRQPRGFRSDPSFLIQSELLGLVNIFCADK